jgi:hypothetical protein
VTVADSRCPKCDSDLLQFGATVFYERSKHESDVSSPATGMVFGAVANEFKSSLSGFNSDENKIFYPALQMLKKVFSRHLSEEEIEKVFDVEILPAVDDLSKDKYNAELFRKVESAIRVNLGDAVYEHYKTKGADVLRILRAGELANELMDKEKGDYDLSIKMFPFFKASEVSCRLHTEARYENLKNNAELREIARWIGIVDGDGDIVRSVNTKNLAHSIYVDDVWLGKKKKTWFDMLCGIFNKEKYGNNLSGSCRTGLALYAFGRDWELKMKKDSESRMTTFPISNILKTIDASDDKIIGIRQDLCELQDMRNGLVHEDVADDKDVVTKSIGLSYGCLKGITEFMRI